MGLGRAVCLESLGARRFAPQNRSSLHICTMDVYEKQCCWFPERWMLAADVGAGLVQGKAVQGLKEERFLAAPSPGWFLQLGDGSAPSYRHSWVPSTGLLCSLPPHAVGMRAAGRHLWPTHRQLCTESVC